MSSASPSRGLAVTSLCPGILGFLTFGCLGIGALVGMALGIVASCAPAGSPSSTAARASPSRASCSTRCRSSSGVVVGIVAAIAIPACCGPASRPTSPPRSGRAHDDLGAGGLPVGEHGLLRGQARVPGDALAVHPGLRPLGTDVRRRDARLAAGEERVPAHLPQGAGPGERGMELPPNASPTSVTGFAYVAVPVKQGNTGFAASAATTAVSSASPPTARPPA